MSPVHHCVLLSAAAVPSARTMHIRSGQRPDVSWRCNTRANPFQLRKTSTEGAHIEHTRWAERERTVQTSCARRANELCNCIAPKRLRSRAPWLASVWAGAFAQLARRAARSVHARADQTPGATQRPAPAGQPLTHERGVGTPRAATRAASRTCDAHSARSRASTAPHPVSFPRSSPRNATLPTVVSCVRRAPP